MTHPNVTLVIPGRNCESTLDRCLHSVVPLKNSGQLHEIIFVDDGSTDSTAEIASRYPVLVIQGTGKGPGAARNLGWQAAETEWIWFIDSDCVAEPGALYQLLPHINDAKVAGVGGSYSNLYPDSLIATLIHEEIVSRHRRMGKEVNFLATFNVLYRRNVLHQVAGFDESLKLAQDAELAYRIIASGHRLRFEFDSRVGHHHPRNFWRYLRTQCRQGYYRMKLYRSHPSMVSGDSYAGFVDYIQPPLACLSWALLTALVFWEPMLVAALFSLLLLLLFQWPMTRQCLGAMGWRGTAFAPMGFARAHVRAVGMVIGAIANVGVAGSAGSDEMESQESYTSTALPTQHTLDLTDVTSVTIIIPSRNRSKKLIKCLKSLQEQTVEGFEVIVVNDGSTDDTRLRLDEYSAGSLPYSLVVLHNEVSLGANPSRNIAIRKSNGQWIAMLDDDCFAEKRWLEELVRIRDQHDAVAVTGNVKNIAISNPWERFFIGQHRVTSVLHNGKPIARRLVAGNALVRRDWLSGTLDEDRAGIPTDSKTSARSDEEGLRIKLQRSGEPVVHAPQAVVYHDHPYDFRGFCLQAFKSGKSTARLVLKYRLGPRWELLALMATPVFLVMAFWFRMSLAFAAISLALFLMAAFYNELCLKGKTNLQAISSGPALMIYYGFRCAGYASEFVRRFLHLSFPSNWKPTRTRRRGKQVDV